MPLLIPAIVLLLLAVILSAYGATRKENRLSHLTFRFVVFLCVTFGILIGGTILLFIAAGWKWGLV
ncbi:MAG: hypothetical protein PHQ86_09095, partial [Dehalococcoidales bacterium]|nr:hypothetical protein [Dehalococcoidales bacterium]